MSLSMQSCAGVWFYILHPYAYAQHSAEQQNSKGKDLCKGHSSRIYWRKAQFHLTEKLSKQSLSSFLTTGSSEVSWKIRLKSKLATSKRHFVPKLLIHCPLLELARSPDRCRSKVCSSPRPRLRSSVCVPSALYVVEYLGKLMWGIHKKLSSFAAFLKLTIAEILLQYLPASSVGFWHYSSCFRFPKWQTLFLGLIHNGCLSKI